MSLSRFITLWTHPDYPPRSVAEDDLARVEEKFGTTFPEDYRSDVLNFGLPHTSMALLDAIVDRDLDLFEVSTFLSPDEIESDTEAWRDIGLPDHLVAFATDCAGNLFCFSTNARGEAQDTIFHFDHDFGTVERVADSFKDWIAGYCCHSPDPDTP